MKGNPGRRLRREGAIKRIEQQILGYEEKIISNKETLKVARKEKDQSNINTCEVIIETHEKKLYAARECLENTQNNLK